MNKIRKRTLGENFRIFILIVLVVLVYVVIYPIGYSYHGGQIEAISAVPVVLVAWFFGIAGGFVSSTFLILINTLIRAIITDNYSVGVFWEGASYFGMALMYLLSVMVGFIGNLKNKLEEQLLMKKAVEDTLLKKTSELKESRQILEKSTKQLQAQYIKSESTQKAMLNLLEDSKQFEEELRKQKLSVEYKVEAQTRELKEEEARLVSSIESLPIGYILTDTQGNVIMTNQAVAKILGNPMDKPLLEYLEDVFDLANRCNVCRTSKQPSGPDEIMYEDRYFKIFLTPVIAGFTSVEVEVSGIVILIEDITEAKVLQRTRDEFFAVASHELRTPLTAIRGNVELMKEYYSEELKNPDLQEMLADIHSSSIRLIEVVNDFLDVSRLEQQRIDFKLEHFDIQALAKKVHKDLIGTAEGKGLDLKLENNGLKDLQVFADSPRVEQVLYNLAGNAIKFTKKGGVTIDVSQMPGGRYAKVRVIDTGMGIAKKNHKLLFRKFQQAGESVLSRDVTQSTGMGLYISKLLIEGMGGKIYLEDSDLEKGSVFAFTLPIIEGEEVPEEE